jgi:mannitol/fructose-specific phosphotransferase system IIA component (Ntr-type)
MPSDTMRLTELFRADTVVTDLPPASREALLAEIVRDLHDKGLVVDRETVTHDLIARENVMSTGVGHGVAIPHAYTDGVENLVAGLYRTGAAVDFGAPDETGVDLFFVVLGPRESRREHIRVLARITRLLGHADFREDLRRATGAGDVMGVLRRFGER